MRKLIFMLVFAIVAIAASAQDFSAAYYYKYTGAASDTVNGGSDYEYVTWQVPRNDIYLYEIEVELDELTGSASGYAQIEGSNDNSHWNLIDTCAVKTSGTEALTADGTVYLGDLSTGIAWRFLRAKLWISTTGTWDINYVIFRAVGKNE